MYYKVAAHTGWDGSCGKVCGLYLREAVFQSCKNRKHTGRDYLLIPSDSSSKSCIYWAQLSGFHLKEEIAASPRNVFEINHKAIDNPQNFDSYSYCG